MSRHFNPLERRERDESRVSLGKVKVLAKTDKAIRVELDTTDTLWVPESCIHDDSEVFVGCDSTKGELVVAAWWAEKEGLS
jgi:hypothetical protein